MFSTTSIAAVIASTATSSLPLGDAVVSHLLNISLIQIIKIRMEWKKVMWSAESKLILFHSDGCIRVTRRGMKWLPIMHSAPSTSLWGQCYDLGLIQLVRCCFNDVMCQKNEWIISKWWIQWNISYTFFGWAVYKTTYSKKIRTQLALLFPVFVSVCVLAESDEIQELLSDHGIKVQKMSEVQPIRVMPARILSHIYVRLGKPTTRHLFICEYVCMFQ